MENEQIDMMGNKGHDMEDVRGYRQRRWDMHRTMSQERLVTPVRDPSVNL